MTETNTRLNPKDLATITVLIISAFIVILNETIMNVALPVLMHEFKVSEDAIQWLATIFMLTMAVVIPATGFLLQRFSTRGVFLLAMGLFTAGTLLAAASPSFAMLLGARVIQASGTAIMMPLLMTTILDLVPAHRRGVIMGNVSIVISVAPAIGPTISGLILQFLNWRFMFLIVAPIAIAALFIGAPRLNKNAEASGTPLSIPSIILSVPAFGGLVYGLSKLSSNGLDTTTLVVLVIAVLSLVTFVMLQLKLQRKDHALLDMRPFTYRPFTLSLVLMVLAMVALFGVIILLPMYLQNVRGLDTLATGLMLLPGGLLMGLLAPFVGRAYDKVGPASAGDPRLRHPGTGAFRVLAPARRRDPDPGDHRPAPDHVAVPRADLHPGVHHCAEPAAAFAALARFSSAQHPAAAGRRRGYRTAGRRIGFADFRGCRGRYRPDRRTDLRILRRIHRGCDLRGRHGRRCPVPVQGPGGGTRRARARRALARPGRMPPALMSSGRLHHGRGTSVR